MPCKYGHNARRYSNGNCSQCLKERNAGRDQSKYADARRAYNKTPEGREAKRRYHRTEKAAAAFHRYNTSEKGHARLSAWGKRNRPKTRFWHAMYEAAKIKATPPWLTAEHRAEIAAIYKLAAELGLTADHEVPLRGKLVCGLHVPWNLRIISASENSSKGNRLEFQEFATRVQ